VGSNVPQIWVTYSEFAALMNCDPAEARKAAIAAGLDRRKSRDGRTRIKLTPPLTDAFLDCILRQLLELQMADCAGELRVLHERMQDRQSPAMAKSGLPPAKAALSRIVIP
jgi:hypothetical protein